jgi:hypothetical protein
VFIEYCHVEATALIEASRDIAEVLLSALFEHGELSGDEVGTIIFNSKRNASVGLNGSCAKPARQASSIRGYLVSDESGSENCCTEACSGKPQPNGQRHSEFSHRC